MKTNVIKETKDTAWFELKCPDVNEPCYLKLSKHRYPRLVYYLRSKFSDNILMLNTLGLELLSLSNEHSIGRKGIFTGRDFLAVLNIKWRR